MFLSTQNSELLIQEWQDNASLLRRITEATAFNSNAPPTEHTNSLDTACLSPATRTPSPRACRTRNGRFHQVLYLSNPAARLACPVQLPSLGSVLVILGTLNAATRGRILVVGYFPTQHLHTDRLKI